MRAMRWLMGLTLLFGGMVQLSAREDQSVDLRGPAPKKGEVTVSKTVFKIEKADVQLKVAGQNLKVKQSLTATEEEEVKLLAVEGRQATKVQTKVVKETIETSTSFGGQTMDDSKDGDLHSEVIISVRNKQGKWKHSLVDNRPTEKQAKELSKRVGPENEDELYPQGKVKVGHAWTVDASALQRVFGGSITELKGKIKMRFVKIEMVGGEACAVIESQGKIRGVAKEDEGTLDVELDMKGTTWRSIKTAMDVKDKASGTIKMSGKVAMDGAKVDLVLEGPFSVVSSSKFK